MTKRGMRKRKNRPRTRTRKTKEKIVTDREILILVAHKLDSIDTFGLGHVLGQVANTLEEYGVIRRKEPYDIYVLTGDYRRDFFKVRDKLLGLAPRTREG